MASAFSFDAESLTETMEVATARWFGASELRNGHLEHPLLCADVYSLGKLLYWLFTGLVYDRDEQEYDLDDRKLLRFSAGFNTIPEKIDDRLIHAGASADDVISQTVRYQPTLDGQRNPAAAILRDQAALFMQIAGKFGLTPSDRARFAVVEAKTSEGAFHAQRRVVPRRRNGRDKKGRDDAVIDPAAIRFRHQAGLAKSSLKPAVGLSPALSRQIATAGLR